MKTLALSIAALLLTAAPAAFAAPPAGVAVPRTPPPSRVVVVKKPMSRAEVKAVQIENRIDRLERELAKTRRSRTRSSFQKQRRLEIEIAELKRDLRQLRAPQYARYQRGHGPNDWRR